MLLLTWQLNLLTRTPSIEKLELQGQPHCNPGEPEPSMPAIRMRVA